MDMLRVPSLPELDDARIADAAPAVRADLVQRLETMWRSIRPYMEPSEDRKPDPRFVEAGIRIVDRMARLYRLDQPGTAAPEVLTDQDLVAVVEQGLQELEQRLQAG